MSVIIGMMRCVNSIFTNAEPKEPSGFVTTTDRLYVPTLSAATGMVKKAESGDTAAPHDTPYEGVNCRHVQAKTKDSD